VLAGNDTMNDLRGRGGDDYLQAREADDTLTGGDGNDRLEGGAGADTLHGDAGFDYAAYYYALAGVTADLVDATRNTEDASGDSYVSIEGLIGSQFADALDGDGASNDLAGLGGDDSLSARAGDDMLQGMGGNDTLDGGAGTDVLIGGTGNDVMDGGAGTDTFRYDAAALGALDVGAGVLDTINNGAGDEIDFTAAVESQLRTGGTPLSALAADTVLTGVFDGGTNIRFIGGALQIDLNGDAAFSAPVDFAIALPGVTSVTYDAARDVLVMA
jgi:Ca2+-binding RTX toxin-like protein